MFEFFKLVIASWWGILLIVLVSLLFFIFISAIFYRIFFKRFYDVLLSGIALLILSPLILILMILGRIKMKGNPFFIQQRPGKKEKIFSLIKFRTMTSEIDAEGNLLPDEKRLTKYGKFLRASSLDELPELLNIFIGNMSIVGPRPLLVEYLPRYSQEQQKRHEVRPGLTGLAQVSGRNAIKWDEKFKKDIEYIQKITLLKDIKIIFQTVLKVFKREGISQEGEATMECFTGNISANIGELSSLDDITALNDKDIGLIPNDVPILPETIETQQDEERCHE